MPVCWQPCLGPNLSHFPNCHLSFVGCSQKRKASDDEEEEEEEGGSDEEVRGQG